MLKINRPVFKTIIVILSLLILIILLISPLTKYAIEKYDEKYTGRNITLDWVYVNPFTGYLNAHNFNIHELESDSIFLETKNLSINISLLKLFNNTFEISELTLVQPKGNIIQTKNTFNFTDIINKFSKADSTIIDSLAKDGMNFNLLDVEIQDGEFHYSDSLTAVSYSINKVNIKSDGYRWDKDTVGFKFDFFAGIGSGDMKGDLRININKNTYRLALVIHEFTLDIIDQYLKDLTNFGKFSAILNADIKSQGDFEERINTTLSGNISVHDFHFGKDSLTDYASFDRLVIAIHELSPKKLIFFYDSISLNKPYFKYEKYDELDNIQTIFGEGGSNIDAAKADPAKFNLIIEIANYIKLISQRFFQSHYKIDRLALYNGDIRYVDYSLGERFSLALDPISIISDSIDKDHRRVQMALYSGIKPHGNVSVNLSINPKDSGEFDLNFKFQKLPLAAFNPYSKAYTSYPFDRGSVELNGDWSVRHGIIKSENHLVIIDPRLTDREKGKDTKWLPLPLVMALVRENGNVIDYEIPISGDLKNPVFHLRDALFDLLENIFIKPVNTPYRMKIKKVETTIENSLTMKWDILEGTIGSDEQKFVQRMAEFMEETPSASITIYPEEYSEKERENILLFEARKKYYLTRQKIEPTALTPGDIRKIEKMSIKDPSFVNYLDNMVKDSLLFTIQDKCRRIIPSSLINTRISELRKEREENFKSYFKNIKSKERLVFSKTISTVPFNGYSIYKIDYKGELPESLLKAYREMNMLNAESPRKQFKEERERKRNKISLNFD